MSLMDREGFKEGRKNRVEVDLFGIELMGIFCCKSFWHSSLVVVVHLSSPGPGQ